MEDQEKLTGCETLCDDPHCDQCFETVSVRTASEESMQLARQRLANDLERVAQRPHWASRYWPRR